jgi:hypothetical protein
MLRRLLLTFSLILSFGFAQIGAVTHEISHYTEASAQNQQQDFNKNSKSSNQPSHSHTCEKCVGYAELGNAISSGHIAITLAGAPNLLASICLQTSIAAKPRTYLARAPPTLA